MFSKEDTAVLRETAKIVHDLSQHPRNEVLRGQWREHTALRGKRPMLFVSPEGSWVEILPPSALRCADPIARGLENELRQRILRDSLLRDDVPIERTVFVERAYSPINEGWGLVPQREASGDQRGAWKFKPVVQEPSDWKKLRKPRLELNEGATRARFEAIREAVGDILDVRLTGCKHFSFHMMHIYCDLRGMNEMMMDLVLEPEMVHDVIAFLTEGFQGLIDQLRAENLISLNNDQQYHYTGGLGYTADLPSPGFDPEHVRTVDVWGAAEAQEFAQVSPAMHEEFILQYERKLLENFGLNGYGCCDDLTNKLDNVKKIKNLRRVGICPWANVEKCADQLGKDYIMTWKPQPAYLAEDQYNAELVERYLAEELRRGKHGHMEIVLRDTHTCRGEPERFTRFVQSARRVIEAVHGEA